MAPGRGAGVGREASENLTARRHPTDVVLLSAGGAGMLSRSPPARKSPCAGTSRRTDSRLKPPSLCVSVWKLSVPCVTASRGGGVSCRVVEARAPVPAHAALRCLRPRGRGHGLRGCGASDFGFGHLCAPVYTEVPKSPEGQRLPPQSCGCLAQEGRAQGLVCLTQWLGERLGEAARASHLPWRARVERACVFVWGSRDDVSSRSRGVVGNVN